jgi:hypothetical protein
MGVALVLHAPMLAVDAEVKDVPSLIRDLEVRVPTVFGPEPRQLRETHGAQELLLLGCGESNHRE